MGADQGPLANADADRRSGDRYRERLEAFAAASSEIFWETDDHLKLLYISPRYQQLSGLPVDEAVGKTLWEISGVDPKLNEGWSAVRDAMLARTSFENLEISGKDGEGLRYAYVISAEPLRSPLGEFQGYRGIGREVTELSKAHMALQRQALVMQEMRDAIFIIGASGRIIDCNAAATQLARRPQIELLDTRISRVLGFRIRVEGWTREALKGLRSGRSWTGDIPYRRDDGSEGVAETSVLPLAHADGDEKEAIVICRDVTGQRKAERALRNSEARLQDVALTSGNYVWETDADGRITFVSDSVGQITGGPVERLIGLHMWAVGTHLAHDLSEFDAVEEKFDQRLAYRDLRVRFDMEDGKPLYWSRSGSPYYAEDGSFLGYRGTSRDITPIVTVEEQLREQAQILDQLQDSVIATDLEGYITKWNAGAEKMYGYSPAEALGQHISFTYAEEDHERLLGNVMDTLIDRGSLIMEGPRIRKSGDVVHVHSSTSLLRNSKGEPKEMIGVSYDITERKWAQDALRESEERYRSIVAALSEGVVFQDRRGRIIDWNAKAEEILGLSGDQLIGMTPVDSEWHSILEDGTTITGDQHPALVTLRTGKPCAKFIMGLRWKGGDIRWLEINTEPLVREGESEPHAVIASFNDITERKEAEEALQRSEERYALAARFGQTAAWEIVPEDGKIYADENLTALTGMSDEMPVPDLDGLLETLYDEDRDYVMEAMRDCFEGRADNFAVEHRTVKADGSIGWFRDEGFVASKPGEKLRIVGTTSEVTQRKEAQQQLQKAQKMEAVGQLTGGVAHDFNNLLAVIIGNLELLREEQVAGSTADEMLDRAIRASRRGAELTQRLLAYSRRQPLAPQATDINALAENMLELGTRTLGESIEIKFQPVHEAWAAHVDPGQLENALLNLALNARDAMPEGGTLSIKTRNTRRRPESEKGTDTAQFKDYVAVEVSDTGTGMSREILEKVFEPFFTTKEVGEGTGLGLSMVYGFVKQSGGQIDIESKIGRGTTVVLYLPRSKQELPDDQGGSTTEFENGAEDETVLIVEDDPLVQELVTLVVKSLGYTVLEASGPDEAMEMLQSDRRIDLLFSDVVLGKNRNGVRLAEEARRLRPDIPILLMSGYTQDTVRDDINEEAFEFIGKPFEKAELAQRIHELLS